MDDYHITEANAKISSFNGGLLYEVEEAPLVSVWINTLPLGEEQYQHDVLDSLLISLPSLYRQTLEKIHSGEWTAE